MAIDKISGKAYTDIDEFSGVATSAISNISGVTASSTPPFITANLKSRYTPATYSGSGALVDTVSGHNITVNGATYSSTQPANFDCDGVNDTLISSSFTQPNADLSFGQWLNPDVQASGVMIQNGVWSNSAGRGILLYRFNGNTYSYYAANSLSNVPSNPSYAPFNQWFYMCWSRNATTKLIRMWKCDVNGVTQLISTTGGSATSVAGSVNFMASGQTATSGFYNGQVGDYHVYDDDLGTAEWTQNFNAQKAYYGL